MRKYLIHYREVSGLRKEDRLVIKKPDEFRLCDNNSLCELEEELSEVLDQEIVVLNFRTMEEPY